MESPTPTTTPIGNGSLRGVPAASTGERWEILFGIGAAGVPEEGPIWQVVLILGGFAAAVIYAVRQYFKQRKQ